MEKHTQLLKTLGLSRKEQLVFEELLGHTNGLTVIQLARSLNLPRPTIYDQIDTLIEKGLILKSATHRGAHFIVADSDTVISILEEKKNSLTKTIENIPDLFTTTDTTEFYTPRFSFYDEKNTAELILRDVLRSRESNVYGYWSVSDMSTVVSPELYSYFHSERVIRNIHLSSLWPHKQKATPKAYTLPSTNLKESLIEIREVPKKIDSYAGYIIYGNKVGFISSKREGYGFVIDSPELSKTMLTQFKYIWSKSKPVKG